MDSLGDTIVEITANNNNNLDKQFNAHTQQERAVTFLIKLQYQLFIYFNY